MTVYFHNDILGKQHQPICHQALGPDTTRTLPSKMIADCPGLIVAPDAVIWVAKDTYVPYYLSNGMTIPLMSEFSNYEEGDAETAKQDCEQKAFKRLAARLKKAFPCLAIILVLDGLYPNGPMIERWPK